LIIIAVVAATATAHILLKIGMNDVGKIGVDEARAPISLFMEMVRTPTILVALPIYAISFGGWLLVLSRLNLSVAYPSLAMLYVLIPILSAIFLSESLSAQHWAGILVIGVGVGIVVNAGLA
jgi:drug/metabolite transporter (DMT)-like permease